jgi:uridine phosphorylase
MTASCSGFFGPQGRVLRAELARTDMIEKLNSFKYEDLRVTNFEMETGAMYGLARILGHECAAVNVIVANRISQVFSKNYHHAMNTLIETVLDRI